MAPRQVAEVRTSREQGGTKHKKPFGSLGKKAAGAVTENTYMLPTTIDLLRAGLKADPTITPAQRAKLLLLLRNGDKAQPERASVPPAVPRVLSRRAVSERLGRSMRYVDRLCQCGILQKVTMPGRVRAIGFREEDVTRVISGTS